MPLAAVGESSLPPSASRCSGEVTVTSLIWPSLRLPPAITVPSGAMLTSLAETPSGSLIGGDRRLPSELTSAPLASMPKLPLRVSATCAVGARHLEVARAFDRQVERIAGFLERALCFAAPDHLGARARARRGVGAGHVDRVVQQVTEGDTLGLVAARGDVREVVADRVQLFLLR